MAHIDRYLADKELSPAERYQGLLVKGQILFKGGRKEECLALLAKIPPEVPSFTDAIVLRGQLLMQAAEKAKANLPSGASADSAPRGRETIPRRDHDAPSGAESRQFGRTRRAAIDVSHRRMLSDR